MESPEYQRLINHPDFPRKKRHTQIMGILYGVIVACELSNVPVTYEHVLGSMKQHCTEKELVALFKEIQNFNALVVKLDIERQA